VVPWSMLVQGPVRVHKEVELTMGSKPVAQPVAAARISKSLAARGGRAPLALCDLFAYAMPGASATTKNWHPKRSLSRSERLPS
jgi:hypothetical protein